MLYHLQCYRSSVHVLLLHHFWAFTTQIFSWTLCCPNQYFCTFSFHTVNKTFAYLTIFYKTVLSLFIWASSSPCLSFIITHVCSIVSPHICLWPHFIRLLRLSCSLQSLPINPVWRADLSALREGACGRLCVFTPHFTSSHFLSGPVSEGRVQHDDDDGEFSLHLYWFRPLCACRIAFIDIKKSQLSHGCCTAAALFLDPQEELIVRSCSSGAGEKPGVGKSVTGSTCRPSVDRLVGVLPSGESHSHC